MRELGQGEQLRQRIKESHFCTSIQMLRLRLFAASLATGYSASIPKNKVIKLGSNLVEDSSVTIFTQIGGPILYLVIVT